MSVCPWNVRMIQTANLGAGRMAPAHRSRTTRRSQTRRMLRWMVNRWWMDGKNHQFIMVDICYYLLILILWLLPWFSTSCHLYPLVTNVTHLETMFNNECHLITSSVNPSWTLDPWIPQPSHSHPKRDSHAVLPQSAIQDGSAGLGAELGKKSVTRGNQETWRLQWKKTALSSETKKHWNISSEIPPTI